MTLYGPLTAQDFLRLLQRLVTTPPDRRFFESVLDAVMENFAAERGFLLRVRRDGRLQVVASHNFEGERLDRPLTRISQHAVRLALASPDSFHHTNAAHLDRRYRTEDISTGARRPIAILVLACRGEGAEDVAVYLDHRFRELEVSDHGRFLVEHWLALAQLGLALRRFDGRVRRLERLLARRSAARVEEGEGKLSAAAHPPEPDSQPVEFHGLWTRSAAMIELFETVRRLHASRIPVLIHGETGSGKSQLAQAVHLASARRERPFVAVNCGALPEALLDSELFGHVRGAFTGADEDREGLIVTADAGTLFLDEIADMSPMMQKKLLRFVENGCYRPVGGKRERRGDVRIVSSTRVDLEGEVPGGRFRADLFFRLCGIRLEIPPLRERRTDVPGLAERFLAACAAETGAPAPRLTEDACRWLVRQPWHGNVRELENLMRQASALGYAELDRRVLVRLAGTRPAVDMSGTLDIDRAVAAVERQVIRRALSQSAGNKSRAAALLGITRKSLYRRLVKYGLIESEGNE